MARRRAPVQPHPLQGQILVQQQRHSRAANLFEALTYLVLVGVLVIIAVVLSGRAQEVFKLDPAPVQSPVSSGTVAPGVVPGVVVPEHPVQPAQSMTNQDTANSVAISAVAILAFVILPIIGLDVYTIVQSHRMARLEQIIERQKTIANIHQPQYQPPFLAKVDTLEARLRALGTYHGGLAEMHGIAMGYLVLSIPGWVMVATAAVLYSLGLGASGDYAMGFSVLWLFLVMTLVFTRRWLGPKKMSWSDIFFGRNQKVKRENDRTRRGPLSWLAHKITRTEYITVPPPPDEPTYTETAMDTANNVITVVGDTAKDWGNWASSFFTEQPEQPDHDKQEQGLKNAMYN